MNPRSYVPALIPLTIAAVIAIVVLPGGSKPYTVRAVFADATGLRVNSDVKVGGIAGGDVGAMTLGPHDQAIVTIDLNSSAAPIGSGATATIRPANLLGEYYVDLQPGDVSGHPLPSGSTLPVSATGESVGLDQVLDTLDATTRDRLAILINETGIAFGDSGRQFAATLSSLPPTLDQARALLGQLTGDNQSIETAISDGNQVLGAMDSRRGDLQNLVSTAAGALATTAAHQASLGRTLVAAPAALASLQSTLVNLRDASDQLRPAAQALLMTGPPLTRTLTALPGFAAAATETLSALRDVSPALTRLGRLGAPPVKQIQPVATRLESYIGTLAPVLNTLDQGGFMNTLLRWMYNWQSVTSTQDALGHVFRVTIAPNSDLISGALQGLGDAKDIRRAHTSKPVKASASRPAPAAAPAPAARSTLQSALAGLVGGTVNKVQPAKNTLVGVLTELLGGSPSSPSNQSSEPPQQSLGSLLTYLLKP
jgi:phospholipid/cholesterol/gamma-HCH transport system substrate-binding protein